MRALLIQWRLAKLPSFIRVTNSISTGSICSKMINYVTMGFETKEMANDIEVELLWSDHKSAIFMRDRSLSQIYLKEAF